MVHKIMRRAVKIQFSTGVRRSFLSKRIINVIIIIIIIIKFLY